MLVVLGPADKAARKDPDRAIGVLGVDPRKDGVRRLTELDPILIERGVMMIERTFSVSSGWLLGYCVVPFS